MAHASGSALYATFGGTVISGDQKKMDWESSVSLIDTTAGADVAESHVKGTSSATINIEWLDDALTAAGSATARALAEGNSGTLIFAPRGTATGNPKYSCVATVDTNGQDMPYDDALLKHASLTRNGDWILNFDTLGSVY